MQALECSGKRHDVLWGRLVAELYAQHSLHSVNTLAYRCSSECQQATVQVARDKAKAWQVEKWRALLPGKSSTCLPVQLPTGAS